MSEPKAFEVGIGQYCEDCSPCVVAFDADRNPRLLNEKVYLKSEVDAVLAEKDRLIAMLEKKLDEMDNLVKEHKDLFLESQKMHLKCANNASTQILRLTRYLYLILADLHASKAQEYAKASFFAGMWLDDNDEKQCYRKEKCAARCRQMADRLGC